MCLFCSPTQLFHSPKKKRHIHSEVSLKEEKQEKRKGEITEDPLVIYLQSPGSLQEPCLGLQPCLQMAARKQKALLAHNTAYVFQATVVKMA